MLKAQFLIAIFLIFTFVFWLLIKYLINTNKNLKMWDKEYKDIVNSDLFFKFSFVHLIGCTNG